MEVMVTPHQGGEGLRDQDLADDLPAPGAHGDRGLHEPVRHLADRRLDDAREERDRADGQRHDGRRGADGGADDARVSGITATIRMMNGTERPTLTIAPSTRLATVVEQPAAVGQDQQDAERQARRTYSMATRP